MDGIECLEEYGRGLWSALMKIGDWKVKREEYGKRGGRSGHGFYIMFEAVLSCWFGPISIEDVLKPDLPPFPNPCTSTSARCPSHLQTPRLRFDGVPATLYSTSSIPTIQDNGSFTRMTRHVCSAISRALCRRGSFLRLAACSYQISSYMWLSEAYRLLLGWNIFLRLGNGTFPGLHMVVADLTAKVLVQLLQSRANQDTDLSTSH